ncbi:MAG: M36 family metallopeptidase [Actinomycetota bacterium]
MSTRRSAAVAAAVALLFAASQLPGGAAVVVAAGPRTLRGDLGPAGVDARETARGLVRRYAARLGVEAEAFRFESVQQSLIGIHVRGREFRGGVPVDGSAVAVHSAHGRVIQIDAYDRSSLPGRPTAAPVGAEAATRAALAFLGVSLPFRRPAVERLLVARAGRLYDTYRVDVISLAPAVAATVDVDAASGAVVRVFDDNRYVDGSATAFDPSPMVSLKDKGLRQPAELGLPVDVDLDSAELTAALVELPLRDLDETALTMGRLQGPWVTVHSLPLRSQDGNFGLTRGDPRFEATMAYAHIDRVQRYYQSLGFKRDKSINAEPQDVVALHIEGFDNSFYQPGNDILLFGTGGVDDGEDAEIILHEYGHATQHAQVDDFGANSEGGAMGEGFGDFLAAAFFAAEISGGFQDECVGEWDATTYSPEDPPCLRRLDGKKKYPDDISGEVHADGEIWSAFLWKLRAAVGDDPVERSDNVLRLVLSSHELLTPEAEFVDGVLALKTAAKALGHSEWAGAIDRAARSFGLPTEAE